MGQDTPEILLWTWDVLGAGFNPDNERFDIVHVPFTNFPTYAYFSCEESSYVPACTHELVAGHEIPSGTMDSGEGFSPDVERVTSLGTH